MSVVPAYAFVVASFPGLHRTIAGEGLGTRLRSSLTSTEFCANFVLQATNAQGLGTGLVPARDRTVLHVSVWIYLSVLYDLRSYLLFFGLQ